MSVGSLDLLVGTCRLWERFEILYNYVSGALHLEFKFVMEYYFVLLCLNACLEHVFLYFRCLILLHLGPRVHLQWYRIRFSTVEYQEWQDLFYVVPIWDFWNFVEWANRANVFPVCHFGLKLLD